MFFLSSSANANLPGPPVIARVLRPVSGSESEATSFFRGRIRIILAAIQAARSGHVEGGFFRLRPFYSITWPNSGTVGVRLSARGTAVRNGYHCDPTISGCRARRRRPASAKSCHRPARQAPNEASRFARMSPWFCSLLDHVSSSLEDRRPSTLRLLPPNSFFLKLTLARKPRQERMTAMSDRIMLG